MTVRIFTDSTSDISQYEAVNLGIGVVPLHVNIGGKSYLDGVDITPDQFYSLLSKEKTAKTAQPSPGEILKLWNGMTRKDDEIVMITISSELSGTYNSAKIAAKERGNVWVVDSRAVAMPLRFSNLEALEMARQGMAAAEIAKRVERMPGKIKLYAAFGTLDYLYAGGRISKAKSILGNLLSIKPIVTLEDGKVVQVVNDHKRTMKMAIEAVVNRLPPADKVSRVGIIHAYDMTHIEEIQEEMEKKYHGKRILKAQLGATLGVYSGPVLYGAAVFEK
jgi:DegV family protein with EDD domain